MSVNHQMINRSNVHFPYFAQTPSLVSSNMKTIHAIPIQVANQHYRSNTFSPSEQLRIRIHENHLSYLSRDDTPFKYELRAKIESLINEYLSIVHHNHKFSFKEMHECFTATVRKPDFDPYKTICAFEAIERYATNLLNYPWRHEYRTIFAFSGFFCRVVDRALVGYQKIFELIGFSFDSSLNAYKMTEMPIDPDRLSQISLECLVAIVECQIMLDIKTLIKSRITDVTWADIFSVRSDYICNTEHAIKLLCDLKKTAKLIDIDIPDYGMKNFPKIELLPSLNQRNSMNKALPSTSSYLESNLDSLEFIDSTPSYSNVSNNSACSGESSNCMFRNENKIVASPIKSHTTQISPKYKITHSNQCATSNNNQLNLETRTIPSPTSNEFNNVLLSEINQFENNRKSSPNHRTKVERKIKVTINDLKAKESGNKVRIDEVDFIDKSLDNDSQSSIARAANVAPVQNIASISNKDGEQKNISQQKSWSCKSCTYQNSNSRDICEMCHKSRNLGYESAPLVSGGRECSLCTLVNGKDDKFCKACNTSLADSPTYI